MKNFLSKLNYLLLVLFLALPLPVLASVLGPNPKDLIPVPSIGCAGLLGILLGINMCAAGQVTFTGLVLVIINLALSIVGLISVLYIIIGGFRYVTAAGNEEASEGAKNTIWHAVIGLIVVILSFVIVRAISVALIGNVS